MLLEEWHKNASREITENGRIDKSLEEILFIDGATAALLSALDNNALALNVAFSSVLAYMANSIASLMYE